MAARAANVAYAAELEALDAPERFRADHARHIAGMAEMVTNFDQLIAATEARDSEEADALERSRQSIERNLEAELSPDYVALLSFLQDDGVSFTDATAEETEYFDAVAAAGEEFAKRNSAFGAALQRSYTSTEALLNALYDAGAGEAVAAVQEVDRASIAVRGRSRALAAAP